MKASIRYAIRRSEWLYRQCIRAVKLANALSWRRIDQGGRFSKRLASLKDTKVGDDCFVVGNGPSLAVHDLEMLGGTDSFASNHIFHVFGCTDWRPTYYITQDIYGGIAREVDAMEADIVFVGDYYWRKVGTSNPRAVCYHGERVLSNKKVMASDSIDRYITDYETVTFTALQIAVYMGYSRIYLIGVDHSYAREIDSAGNVLRDTGATSHFYEDNAGATITANVEGMERAYRAVWDLAEERGARIYNATRGGALEVFERADLDEVLGQIGSERMESSGATQVAQR